MSKANSEGCLLKAMEVPFHCNQLLTASVDFHTLFCIPGINM